MISSALRRPIKKRNPIYVENNGHIVPSSSGVCPVGYSVGYIEQITGNVYTKKKICVPIPCPSLY